MGSQSMNWLWLGKWVKKLEPPISAAHSLMAYGGHVTCVSMHQIAWLSRSPQWFPSTWTKAHSYPWMTELLMICTSLSLFNSNLCNPHSMNIGFLALSASPTLAFPSAWNVFFLYLTLIIFEPMLCFLHNIECYLALCVCVCIIRSMRGQCCLFICCIPRK